MKIKKYIKIILFGFFIFSQLRIIKSSYKECFKDAFYIIKKDELNEIFKIDLREKELKNPLGICFTVEFLQNKYGFEKEAVLLDIKLQKKDGNIIEFKVNDYFINKNLYEISKKNNSKFASFNFLIFKDNSKKVKILKKYFQVNSTKELLEQHFLLSINFIIALNYLNFFSFDIENYNLMKDFESDYKEYIAQKKLHKEKAHKRSFSA